MVRRTTSVVVQTRVDPAVAATIKMVARLRGLADAAVVRGWLEATAAALSQESFEAELRRAVDRDRARRAASQAAFTSISAPDGPMPPPAVPAVRRGPSVVVASRVPPEVAAKIRAVAAVKGISDADLIRGWLEESAAAVTPASFEDEVHAAIERDRAGRLALLGEFAAAQATPDPGSTEPAGPAPLDSARGQAVRRT